ncbi:hypothetical protein [Caproiciproducens sp. LBM24188]|nr:hypothetical protein [Oscillospiraceae bacterium]HHV31251.1 hypothetical protein [Clostridiales bacterium]
MKRDSKLQTITIAALLSAIGIVIPMFCPKIVLEPASFTLASHVPVFIAVFISPVVAIAVSLVSAVGFLFAGFPLVVVLRALSHLVFATIGALILKKSPNALQTMGKSALFGFFLSIIHAACEVVVVTLFYFGNGMSKAYYAQGYVVSVLLLVGVGSVIHSMVDYSISMVVWKPLVNVITIPVSAKVLPSRRKPVSDQ